MEIGAAFRARLLREPNLELRQRPVADRQRAPAAAAPPRRRSYALSAMASRSLRRGESRFLLGEGRRGLAISTGRTSLGAMITRVPRLGEMPQSNREILFQADTAVRGRMPGRHPHAARSGPGDALHVGHRGGAIEIGAVPSILADDAEYAGGRRMIAGLPVDAAERAISAIVVINRDLLVRDRDDDLQRALLSSGRRFFRRSGIASPCARCLCRAGAVMAPPGPVLRPQRNSACAGSVATMQAASVATIVAQIASDMGRSHRTLTIHNLL